MKWIICILLLLFIVPLVRVHSLSPQEQIDEYNKKLVELQGEKDSLSKQIALFDSSIALSTLKSIQVRDKINTLAKDIDLLSVDIESLENIKTKRLELILHRIPETYKRLQVSPFGVMLFSSNVSDFFTRRVYLSYVQQKEAMKYRIHQEEQNTLNERKDQRENKKKEQEKLRSDLEFQLRELDKQKREKSILLVQTKNSEVTYQQLLAQAKAQLAGFASFADTQGTALLSGQTMCNSWGCYYNQRDSQWGNVLINGQGGGCSQPNEPCNILRVGCLITSVAMVTSHLGHKEILPSDIAISGAASFSVGTAMLVKGTISVKGVNINRQQIASKLNPDLLNSGPVIVGIYHGQFGTHFVVIKSYTDGKYMMYDPYEANGHDKSFTDYYSLGSVFQVDRISI